MGTNAKDGAVFHCGSTPFSVSKILLALAFVCWRLLPACAQAQAPTFTYTYTGNPLTSTNGGCSGCAVVGSFTLSQPLSANMGTLFSGAMVPNQVPFLVSYSFSAGSITITKVNGSAPLIGVVTDSTGTITAWNVLFSTSSEDISGTITQIIASSYNPVYGINRDGVTYEVSCGIPPCGGWNSGNTMNQGAWAGNTGGDIRAATAPFTALQNNGPVTISWSPPFPDTNYTAVCTVETTPSAFFLPVIRSRSSSSMTVYPRGAVGGLLDCIAVPDTDVSHVIHARQTFSGSPTSVTATWSPVYPDPTYELKYYAGNATPVCTMETEDSSFPFPDLNSLITVNYGSGYVSSSITVADNDVANGTLHCIEVPDFDQTIVRGSRTPIVTATSTTQATWGVPFPNSNYVASCSIELDGAAGTVPNAVVAILANSKMATSMSVSSGLSYGTINCVALVPPIPPSPPPAAPCPANASNVFPFAGGNKSSDGHPIAMLATFSPSTSDTPITLLEAANDCGVTEFDWQQIVTAIPLPFADGSGGTLTPPFYDPPPAGYTYVDQDPNDYALLNAYPFYYNQEIVPTGCAININGGCQLLITSANDQALNMFDSPRLFNASMPPGKDFEFKTSLVGVLANNKSTPPYVTWTWKSTYSKLTDTGGVSGVQIQTASSEPVDGSGTGGVSITSINGVTQTPPITTCTATPNTLWPPNGNFVPVSVSGNMTAGTSALAAETFSVVDSYGQDQPNGSVSLNAGGSYSFTIPLIAFRNGSDINGRTYTIYVIGQDTIGNVGVCSAIVAVPHDQGNN